MSAVSIVMTVQSKVTSVARRMNPFIGRSVPRTTGRVAGSLAKTSSTTSQPQIKEAHASQNPRKNPGSRYQAYVIMPAQNCTQLLA